MGEEKPPKLPAGQVFVPVSGPARAFHKTASHNFGRNNDMDFNLTATAFRNGHSSAVATTLDTRSDKILYWTLSYLLPKVSKNIWILLLVAAKDL
jgi:hypothetical protein